MSIPERWPLPDECPNCGSTEGALSPSRKLECDGCDPPRYVKWVSKDELGAEKSNRRSPSRPDLKPAERDRIFASHGYACLVCGKRPPDVTLEVGHLISVADYETYHELIGMTIEELNHQLNQAPMCETCNSGIGSSTVAVNLMLRWLRIAIAKQAGDL